MDLLEGYGSSEEEKEEASAGEVGMHNRIGKKVLSLTAVLPQAILDELTKSQVQGSDSDDEDTSEPRAVDKKRHISISYNDEGLSSLLSDLQRAPAASARCFSKKTNKPSTEKMGAAFLTSTNSSILKSEDEGTVREIHEHLSDTTRGRVPQEPKSGPTSILNRKPVGVSLAPTLSKQEEQPVIDYDTSEKAAAKPSTTKEAFEQEQLRKRRPMSRRDIEKALRQGTLPEELDDFATNMTQPEQFTPQPETYAVPRHGIKVSAAAALYDPSKGHAVGGSAGRGRGKNQIHHLMATAANLELQRARGLASDPQAGKVHRVNAKRKYGW